MKIRGRKRKPKESNGSHCRQCNNTKSQKEKKSKKKKQKKCFERHYFDSDECSSSSDHFHKGKDSNFSANGGHSKKMKRGRSRNSERRKEKSRNAARCRRGRESEIFSELSDLLPIPPSAGLSLDKASVIRVAIAYLRTRDLASSALTPLKKRSLVGDLPKGLVDNDEASNDVFLKALDGFLLVLTTEADIVYTSQNISEYLGMAQVDVIGQSLLDYTHACDHDEVRHMTSLVKEGSLSHCFVRLKCTLTPRGRNINFKSAGYKVIKLIGQLIQKELPKVSTGGPWLVALAVPVPHPSNIEIPLDKQSFVSKHTLDMKFTYVNENVFHFCGYSPADLLGRSLYEMNHALDTPIVLEAYKTLRKKGQVETERYRFLSFGGGFVWVVTQATLIKAHKDARPQSVVCLNYVISSVQSPGVIFSEHQLQCSKSKQFPSQGTDHSPPFSAPTPSPSALRYNLVPEKRREDLPRDVILSNKPAPIASTCSLLLDRTEDMLDGFLTFTDNGLEVAVLKEEPEDLTHLAPSVEEDCVPLEVPAFQPNLNYYLLDASSSSSGSLSPESERSSLTRDDALDILSDQSDSDSPLSGSYHSQLPSHKELSPEQEDSCVHLQGERGSSRDDLGITSKTPDSLTSTSEWKKNQSITKRPVPTAATSLLFTEVDPHSSMDLLKEFEMKPEEEMDLRAPYIPTIDEVLVFDPDELFLANLSDHSNGFSTSDDDTCSKNKPSSPFGFQPPFLDSSSPLQIQKMSMDTGGEFVDPNQVLPGQFIQGDESDSSQQLKYLLEVESPASNRSGERFTGSHFDRGPSRGKRRFSLEDQRVVSTKRLCYRNSAMEDDSNGVLLLPKNTPIMQQLLVSKDTGKGRRQTISSLLLESPSGSYNSGFKRKDEAANPVNVRRHSVLRNLLVSGRDDEEGYSVLNQSLSSAGNTPGSSPGTPKFSDWANENKLPPDLDSLASIPLNSEGKVELTREQLSALLNKAGLLRRPSRMSTSSSSGEMSPSFSSSSSPTSSSPRNFFAFSSPIRASVNASHLKHSGERQLPLMDPDFAIPSLMELTSLDYEVNAPAPTPSLLHGEDLLHALDHRHLL